MTATTHSPASRARWLGLAAFGIILLLAALALPFWASATTLRSEGTVSVGVGETVPDDLFAFANTVRLAGRADHDVFAAANTVDIRGEIGGSLNAAAGDVTVTGPVANSVRLIAGDVTIDADIGGDLFVTGGSVTIAAGATIDGDVHVYGRSLDVRGSVGGDILGSIGDLELSGAVEGNVNVEVDDLTVGRETTIGGDLSYVSPSRGQVQGGATIDGVTDHRSIAPWGTDDSLRGRFFSPLVRTVWLLVAGALVIGLAPRVMSALNANLRTPVAAGVAGLIALVLVPALAALLAVTIVGLPASLLLLAAWLIALYLSQVVVGQRLGALLLPRRWNDGSRGYLLLTMTLGVLILAVLRHLPVPFLGSLVSLVIVVFGLGAAVLLLRQARPWYTASAVRA